MSTKKSSTPVRRLPSRNSRADSETGSMGRRTVAPFPTTSSRNPAGTGTTSGDLQDAASSMETNAPHSTGMDHSLDTSSRYRQKKKKQHSQEEPQIQGSDSTARIHGAGTVTHGRLSPLSASSSSAPSATPGRRGRGRPRKKSVGSNEDHTPAVSSAVATGRTAGPAGVEPTIPAATPSTASNDREVQRHQRSGQVGSGQSKRGSTSEKDTTGHDSDDWSDDDEVHHLPDEIKAQFGNIVWAKCRGNPPWPAQVWDPRFLGGASLAVARLAYNSLGHSHLVKFYDNKGSFSAVPYKSISAFDPTELPKHLKVCKNPKKKEALKDDVQVALEEARCSRAERLAVMHRMGRSSAPPKTGKAKKSPSSQPSPSAASGAAAGASAGAAKSSTASVAATEGSVEGSAEEIAHAGTSKRRGRGRPRKNPIKELEADRPSSSSSGAEYELELPKDLEEETKAGAGEAADGSGQNDAMDKEMEQRKEQENENEEEEQDEEVEGGDDDEEEYTAEPEADDEDDKIFDESCSSPKKSSRRRGRPRKGGGRSRDAGAGNGGSKSSAQGREGISAPDSTDSTRSAQKRPRPNSPSPRAADESQEDDVAAPGTRKKAKQAGGAKARALAAVRAFVAKLPPKVYGRDEGWISTKGEARASSRRASRKAHGARDSSPEAHGEREARESPSEAHEERETRESRPEAHGQHEARQSRPGGHGEREARETSRESSSESNEARESSREAHEAHETRESPREDHEARESPRKSSDELGGRESSCEADEAREEGLENSDEAHEAREEAGTMEVAETGTQASREATSGGVKRERAAGEKSEEEQSREKKPKVSKSGLREERQKRQASKRRQQQGKNSPQRVQHRGGGDGDGGRVEMSTSGTGASSNLESQVLTAQKLTQRLGKSSVEEIFNKDDVLDVLRRLGELQESVELLQQSGCGKAVANVRKYFFESQVRHHDEDVATAASALRSRWVATLGKGAPAPASAPTPASTSVSASGASSADGKRENAGKHARSHHDDPKMEGSSAGARPGRATIVGVGRYARHRENGGQAMKMKKTVGSKVEVKSEVATAAPSVTGDAPPGGVVKEEAPQQAALDEPRRRAMGMLTSVLGSAALATKRCAAIEQELFVSQGEKVGKEYLRRLRSAVFSMEGVEAQRLRNKVMSEMVVPRDFVLKSSDELRALARMV